MTNDEHIVRSEAEGLPSRALNTDSLTNWRLVPVKYIDADECVRPGITNEMVDAFWSAFNVAQDKGRGHYESTFAGWHALIEAAPKPEASPLYRALQTLRQYVQLRFSIDPAQIKGGGDFQCVELNDLWHVLCAADLTWGTEWSRSYVEKMQELKARGEVQP